VSSRFWRTPSTDLPKAAVPQETIPSRKRRDLRADGIRSPDRMRLRYLLQLTDRSLRFRTAFVCNQSSQPCHLRDKVPYRQLILHLDNPERANHRLKTRRWHICSAGSQALFRGSAAAHIPPISNRPSIARQRSGASLASYLLRASARVPSFIFAFHASGRRASLARRVARVQVETGEPITVAASVGASLAGSSRLIGRAAKAFHESTRARWPATEDSGSTIGPGANRSFKIILHHLIEGPHRQLRTLFVIEIERA
jgi:hypothetical protein